MSSWFDYSYKPVANLSRGWEGDEVTSLRVYILFGFVRLVGNYNVKDGIDSLQELRDGYDEPLQWNRSMMSREMGP